MGCGGRMTSRKGDEEFLHLGSTECTARQQYRFVWLASFPAELLFRRFVTPIMNLSPSY